MLSSCTVIGRTSRHPLWGRLLGPSVNSFGVLPSMMHDNTLRVIPSAVVNLQGEAHEKQPLSCGIITVSSCTVFQSLLDEVGDPMMADAQLSTEHPHPSRLNFARYLLDNAPVHPSSVSERLSGH